MRHSIIADRFAHDVETRSKIILGVPSPLGDEVGENGDRPRIIQRLRSTSRRRGAN